MSTRRGRGGGRGGERGGGGRRHSASGGGSAGGRRSLSVKVSSAKGRKLSSTRWLARQLNDPFVAAARAEGYRSRAAYKLVQIDERFDLLTPGMRVVDLGAAPGGWSQVAARAVSRVEGANGANGVDGVDGVEGAEGQVIAVDLAEMVPLAGVVVLRCDFMAEDAPKLIAAALRRGKADAVLSDMAAPTTGHRKTDHLRIMGLCEAALAFAREVLSPGGLFLAKVLQGGTEGALLRDMKRDFRTVRHVKPEASRASSAELYVLATGFRAKSEERA